MSDYTTQLRFICESYAGRSMSGSSSDVDDIIEMARPKIFDFDYPIFNTDYKQQLESKILQHYYTQEIGLETVGLWKLKLRTKMREIMPYYNQLYESELLKFDPFKTIDYNITGNENETGSSHDEGLVTENGSDTRDINSERNINRKDKETIETVAHDETDGTSAENGLRSDTYNGYKETDKRANVKTTNPNTTTLVKHSDTPLGSVNNATGDSSNYLSDVTETEVSGGNSVVEQVGSNGDTHEISGSIDHRSGNGTDHSEDPTTTNHNETDTASNSERNLASDTKDIYEQHDEGINTKNTTSETDGNNESKKDFFTSYLGKNSAETYSEMLQKFRSTFLNIDMDVINDLQSLFMLIW